MEGGGKESGENKGQGYIVTGKRKGKRNRKKSTNQTTGRKHGFLKNLNPEFGNRITTIRSF